MSSRRRAAIVLLALVSLLAAGCAGEPADTTNETDEPSGEDEAEESRQYEVSGPADETHSVSGNLGGFSPSSLTVSAGATVTVTFENEGSQAHNWGVDVDGDGETEDDARTPMTSPGETGNVTFSISEPGDYTFYCDVPGHRNQGMEGTLTVE